MTIAKVIGYATESAKDFAADALSGKELEAPEAVKAERRKICDACETKVRLGALEFCGECKCSVIIKTAGSSFHCPLYKWDRWHDEEETK